jgi:hypothetical protein
MKTIDEIRARVDSKRAEILARDHIFLRARPAFPILQAHDPEGYVSGLESRYEELAERLADVLLAILGLGEPLTAACRAIGVSTTAVHKPGGSRS